MNPPRRLPDDVVLIEPLYWSNDASTKIELGSEPVVLRSGTLLAKGTGTANLALRPEDQVIITVALDGSGDDHAIVHGAKHDLSLKFGENGQRTKVICTRSTIRPDGTIKLDLIVRSGPFTICQNRRVRMRHVVTHLINFPDFLSFSEGSTDFIHRAEDGASTRLGRLILAAPDWRIEIQAHPRTKRIVNQLKSDGGYAITHVVRIERADRRSFSVTQLEGIVHRLHQFVSFARGQATSIFGTTGFGRDQAVVYQQWAGLPSTRWGSRTSWFDVHHGETLASLFPDFLVAFNDPAVGRGVRTALYWFLRSNRGGDGAGTDGAVILSQAALEGLAMGYLSSVSLPVNGNAADRIRRACKHLDIPTDIPTDLKYLRHGKVQGVWTDGPHAITTVRNNLVHAGKQMAIPIGPAVIEAWRLAQWYLELAILRLCKFEGVYSNRLSARWVGEVEFVPWVKRKRTMTTKKV